MISSELSHNPYLLETKVLFNGHEPQVNSAINKHVHEALINWVEEVPQIFHDEMNGYDFDFYFSGTDADYENVREAFEMQTPEGSVQVKRKGTLDSPTEKMSEVLALLEWLGENYNPHLDLEMLLEHNPSLVDTAFPLLMLHSPEEVSTRSRITLEQIGDVTELNDSDLTEAPILIFVTPQTEQQVGKEVQHLLDRRDVNSKQLFFVIQRSLKKDRVMRVLSDLGVSDPQIVAGAGDPDINKYIESHLVSDYVRNAIRVLDAEVQRITSELGEASRMGAKTGALKEERINALDNEISRLRDADDAFEQLSVLGSPREFAQAKQQFRDAIYGWRSRKRRIDGEYDAWSAARDLDTTIRQRIEMFSSMLSTATNDARQHSDEDLALIFVQAKVDSSFRPTKSAVSLPVAPQLPDLRDEFLALKKTSVVEQRHDFLSLFGSSASPSDNKTESVSYYLDEWRNRAIEIAYPILVQLDDAYSRVLESDQQWAIAEYRAHIKELIAEREQKKGHIVGMLTDEEKVLRIDGDWLSSFKTQLRDIKRG